LAELILHELVHGTVYSKKSGDFNEALASFVGGEAALAYFAVRDGPEAPSVAEGRRLRERDRHDEEFFRKLHAELAELYAGPLARDAKLAAREDVFAKARAAEPELVPAGFNNASLLGELRYSGLDVFEKAFEKEGRDFRRFLERARRAARSKDPFGAMSGRR
jgi:predicted aminopeptidase